MRISPSGTFRHGNPKEFHCPSPAAKDAPTPGAGPDVRHRSRTPPRNPPRPDGISPLLNLGASTGHFRHVARPHIQAHLLDPLDQAGVAVYHSDLKAADGVDLAGDILDPAMLAQLQAMTFGCVLRSNCSSMCRTVPR